MDPFSITGGVITFLGFSGACAKRLRKLIHDTKHAPDEILAISNEISDLNIVLSDLEAASRTIENASAVAQSSLPEPDFGHAVTDQLAKARLKLHQLDSLLSELYITLPNGRNKFQRLSWIRKKGLATVLQRDLVNIRRTLGLLLASKSASSAVRIELSLQRVYAETGPALRPPDPQHSLRLSPSGASTNDPSNDGSSPPTSFTTVAAFQSGTSQIQLDSIDSLNLSSQQSTGVSRMASRAGQLPLGSKDASSTFLQTVRQVGQFGALTFHVHRLARCDGTCTCVCHSRSRFQSPKPLNQFLGALFIGYAGLPVWTRNCDKSDCSNQYSRTLQVSYSFPMWLLSKTIDFVAAMTYNNEPHIGLKVRNRVQTTENSIFTFARNGNLSGIVESFKRRKASPNDLSSRTGETILQIALEVGQIETCQFLLNIGVDPYIVDDNGNSAALEISKRALSKYTVRRAQEFEAAFSNITCAHSELWDFSYLHNVVVGILHADLEITLQNPDYLALLNVTDSHGRSPLHWAALRGDERAIEILLRAGADACIQGREKRTPLHYAIESGNVRCVELLLMAGCNVHNRDIVGHAALQVAAWAADMPAMLEVIFLAGASLNAKSHYGATALHSAADLNHYRNVEYLLAMGAELECSDNDGDTPLYDSIRYGNSETLEVLLRHGARFDYTNKSGQTALHIAALFGTLRGLELLMTSGLEGLSTESRDEKGKTAMEAFYDRVAPPDGFKEALEALLKHVDSLQGAYDDNDHEDENSDIFVDALEHLDVTKV